MLGDHVSDHVGVEPEVFMTNFMAERDDLAPWHVWISVAQLGRQMVGSLANGLQTEMTRLPECSIVCEVSQ